MGPRAWLGSVVVLGLVLAPARGQTQLAWKWNVGDRFYLETVNTLTAITKADNQEVKGSLETTTVDQYKVAKSDATAIVLEKTLLAQRFKNTSSNGNEADAEVQKRAEALARKLEGLVLIVTFDAGMQKAREVTEGQVGKLVGKARLSEEQAAAQRDRVLGLITGATGTVGRPCRRVRWRQCRQRCLRGVRESSHAPACAT